MRIAVVTPSYRTPREWLEPCLQSVRSQTVPCTHFLVHDGPELEPASAHERQQVLRLPIAHGDNGNAARAIGSISAICQGFDAIAYLDADNWYEPDHIESLVALHERTGAAVCSSARTLYEPAGALLGRCPEVDGVRFVDTSCFLITAAAFALVPTWYLMPKAYTPMCDRVFFERVSELNLPHAHTGLATLAFRTTYRGHFEYFGKQPPPGAKFLWMSPQGAEVEVL